MLKFAVLAFFSSVMTENQAQRSRYEMYTAGPTRARLPWKRITTWGKTVWAFTHEQLFLLIPPSLPYLSLSSTLPDLSPLPNSHHPTCLELLSYSHGVKSTVGYRRVQRKQEGNAAQSQQWQNRSCSRWVAKKEKRDEGGREDYNKDEERKERRWESKGNWKKQEEVC